MKLPSTVKLGHARDKRGIKGSGSQDTTMRRQTATCPLGQSTKGLQALQQLAAVPVTQGG